MTILWILTTYHLARYCYLLSVVNETKLVTGIVAAVLTVLFFGAQILGHKVFEKRSPAFMVNTRLAHNATFFVTAEVLRFFGWRAEQFVKLDKEIEKRIEDFRNGVTEDQKKKNE